VDHYRNKYDCGLVLFGGDMFHIPDVLDTVTFQETYKKIEWLAKRSNQSAIIAGNHDMASGSNDGAQVSTVYATRNLRSTNLVVGRYGRVPMDDVVVHCIPYLQDHSAIDGAVRQVAENIKRDPKLQHLMLIHLGLDKAVNGPNEIRVQGYSVDRLQKLGARKIFAGHHHHPQTIGNLEVIGSPLQHNMLDRDDRRGLLIYDTETEGVLRIWLSGPRFFMYEIDSVKSFDKFKRDQDIYRGGYVRIMLMQGIASESKVADIVGASAKMYRILPMRQKKSNIRSEAVTNKAVANIGNLGAVVEDFVDHVKPVGLKRSRLISIGKKLVSDGSRN
jgi:DNA repair exonuclease SbcCD nuclease subunit